MTGRRLVSFGGAAIALEHEGPAASDVVRFLFGDLDDGPGVEPSASLELRPAASEGMLRLTVAGAVLNDSDTPGRIAGQLAAEAATRLADRSSGGMLFHAAAVAWGPHGAMLPASSGSGKTTLAARLVRDGFTYLSDELAYVPADRTTVEGFGRPLSLKAGAWPALEDELGPAPAGDHVLVTGDGLLLRPGWLNPASARCRPQLKVLIFPRREAGATGLLRRLTKAEAALAMLANLVNARNLTEHGLPQVARLAGAMPAYSAVYDEAATIVPAVRDLLSGP